MNDATKRTDLLRECNDQGVPVADFRATFCERCRNSACVNAGWAGSTWESRISTQVDRFLKRPLFADPQDPKFNTVRALRFLEIAPPLVINSNDPWQGPGVHLATPDGGTLSAQHVDAAVAALGGKPPVVTPQPPAEPPPVHAAPVEPAKEAPVEVAPGGVVGLALNTAFPAEGVMLDGSPVPPPLPPRGVPPVQSGGGGVQHDPWAVSERPKTVPAGARIKMGH